VTVVLDEPSGLLFFSSFKTVLVGLLFDVVICFGVVSLSNDSIFVPDGVVSTFGASNGFSLLAFVPVRGGGIAMPSNAIFVPM
jgi:hypothetical protein